MSLSDAWLSATFAARKRFWGRVSLRRRPPRVEGGAAREAERAFYRLIVEAAPGEIDRASVMRLWDVGCRNWSYAPALAELFPAASLVGVELDGGRRYWDLHRRIDYARAQAERIRRLGRDATCLDGDFRELPLVASLRGLSSGAAAAFCFFFPFVSAHPCRRWGLPSRYADFARLLDHALGALRASGSPRALFLSCHQGAWEAEIAANTYREAGLPYGSRMLDSARARPLWPSPHATYVVWALR